jgi:UDP-N-acetylglucosamine 1-carboxyvinyltransferase
LDSVNTTSWHVEPSGPLHGDVVVRGSKNAVTKHMVAATLAEGESEIGNAPDLADVTITVDILRSLGFGVDCEGDASPSTRPRSRCRRCRCPSPG